MSARVAAVVLAAGRSLRFGPANKLLAVVDTEPLIVRAMRALAASPVSQILVVTGRDHDAIAGAVTDFKPRIVHNPDYARGMGCSIAAGVKALAPEAGGALIVQADMPFLSTQTIRRLVAKFEASGGKALVMPEAPGGIRGNPVLWPRDLFAELAGLDGPEGGKALIGLNADRVETVMAEAEEFIDIDSADALETVLRMLRSMPPDRR